MFFSFALQEINGQRESKDTHAAANDPIIGIHFPIAFSFPEIKRPASPFGYWEKHRLMTPKKDRSIGVEFALPSLCLRGRLRFGGHALLQKKTSHFSEETAVNGCAYASEFPGGLGYHPDPRKQTYRSEES